MDGRAAGRLGDGAASGAAAPPPGAALRRTAATCGATAAGPHMPAPEGPRPGREDAGGVTVRRRQRCYSPLWHLVAKRPLTNSGTGDRQRVGAAPGLLPHPPPLVQVVRVGGRRSEGCPRGKTSQGDRWSEVARHKGGGQGSCRGAHSAEESSETGWFVATRRRPT